MREIGRRILQWTLNEIETNDASVVASRLQWNQAAYRRNRKTKKLIDTRFGPVTLKRWFYQNVTLGEPGIAPLDLRLGLIAGRMLPSVAKATGRLSADLAQQDVLASLAERFSIRPGVATLRKCVADISSEVRTMHDEVAIERLSELLTQARQSEGDHEPLLQVGRDGVFVQTRPCWEEASCGTLAVYDRARKRLGTVYLGEMPEANQPTMTSRLTRVIIGTLTDAGEHVPILRYVTDAGCHPQAYFRKVLSPMKHPVTGESLDWSWGVDFYHACEYVSKLAYSILGSKGTAAEDWVTKQRKILKTKTGGIARVIRSAAQLKRRHGCLGTKSDYATATGYLKRYRKFMDFAERRAAGEPIGSGITEAGCKVIFNQRMKQSGMRWHRDTGQRIVDLRTAVRGRLWDQIWDSIGSNKNQLPEITYKSSTETDKIQCDQPLLS